MTGFSKWNVSAVVSLVGEDLLRFGRPNLFEAWVVWQQQVVVPKVALECGGLEPLETCRAGS